MKRTLYCPIMFNNISYDNRQEYVNMLKDVDAKYLFIATGRDFIYKDSSVIQSLCKDLESHIRFFQNQNLQVGIWINSFGFGNPMTEEELTVAKDMKKIKSITGKQHQSRDAICPEDETFTNLFCEQIRTIAALKPDLIMLDDDLCLSVRPGIGCFCDTHMKLLEQKIGYSLSEETLLHDIFYSENKELRKAWLEVMGNTIKNFCQKLRTALDEVDASVRLGFCAGYTSWDMEGATAIELTRILAGNTKPFLRFTSAPYWVSKVSNRFKGQRLHGVIEFARAQAHWCKDEDIEYFNEADSYPRARYQVPANLLECFDAATVASDGMNSLKYLFDYFSAPSYEQGYWKIHKKNQGLYNFLETHFENKKTIGIHVFERMCKTADMDFPEDWDEKSIMTTSLPVAGSVLTSLGIPVTYDQNPDCGIAFNVNVDSVEQLPQRMIIDIVAAMRLKEHGVDVGLETASLIASKLSPSVEYFADERVGLANSSGRYYRCQLHENATVESWIEINGEKIPTSYRYNNGETEWLVYTFDAYSLSQSATVFQSYARQKQLLDFYSDFPVLRKCPYVYQLCKRTERETVAFFANIFEDELFDFELELNDDYKDVECYGIDATLEQGRLKVHSEVKPYGMFAIRLIK